MPGRGGPGFQAGSDPASRPPRACFGHRRRPQAQPRPLGGRVVPECALAEGRW